jgi:hypothetical protein
MPVEQEDALRRARNLAKEADRTGSQNAIKLSIAYALVAICERLDQVIDKDSDSLNVNTWTVEP